jgi:hypothetical protein
MKTRIVCASISIACLLLTATGVSGSLDSAGAKGSVGVGLPEFGLQFLARDHFTGALQQQDENVEGLTVQVEADSVPTQAALAAVYGEVTEAELVRKRVLVHG